MSTSSHHVSARIYQFVPRARTSRRMVREEAASVVDITPQRLPMCDFGSGSYHDAAIQDERQRKV